MFTQLQPAAGLRKLTARACALLVVPLTLAVLSGCPRPVPRTYAPPTVDELLGSLRQSRAGVLSLRARAKADYLETGGAGRVKIDISILAARPARLRLAGENSLTGPILTLATDGQSFQILDLRENRFRSGSVNPCNMARVLGVALSPAQAVEILLGAVPLPAQVVRSELSYKATDGGREVVTLHLPDGSRGVLAFQKAGLSDWDLREAEAIDETGTLRFRVRHESYEAVPLGKSTIRLPSVTYIEDGPRKSDVRLRWRERELNPSIEPELFKLEPPSGIPVEPDLCSDSRPAETVGAPSP